MAKPAVIPVFNPVAIPDGETSKSVIEDFSTAVVVLICVLPPGPPGPPTGAAVVDEAPVTTDQPTSS